MSILRDVVRMILVAVALGVIAIALGAAWLLDRAYDAVNA